jgi:hypothetical protein
MPACRFVSASTWTRSGAASPAPPHQAPAGRIEVEGVDLLTDPRAGRASLRAGPCRAPYVGLQHQKTLCRFAQVSRFQAMMVSRSQRRGRSRGDLIAIPTASQADRNAPRAPAAPRQHLDGLARPDTLTDAAALTGWPAPATCQDRRAGGRERPRPRAPSSGLRAACASPRGRPRLDGDRPRRDRHPAAARIVFGSTRPRLPRPSSAPGAAAPLLVAVADAGPATRGCA